MSELADYENLLLKSPQATIFHEPWWLDTVAPGQWKIARYKTNDGLAGALPYIYSSFRGMTTVGQSSLSPVMGPLLLPLAGKYVTALGKQHQALEALLKELPQNADAYNISCHPSLLNGLPFIWAGFTPTLGFTYQLDKIDDQAMIWQNMKSELHADIKKAESLLQVSESDDFRTLYQLVHNAFQSRGGPPPYSEDLLTTLGKACLDRNRGKLFLGRNQTGAVVQGAFIVWDQQSAYYLVGGADPAQRIRGASALLIWQAIKGVSSMVKRFDFEGSSVKSIESFFRSFGATQVGILCLEKERTRYKLKRKFGSFLRRVIK